MASKFLVPVEEYLNTAYEHDPEYVRGEIVERGMPNTSHSKAQTRVIEQVFLVKQKGHNLHAFAELRSRLEPDLYRIPDVAIYSPAPMDETPEHPPLAVLEIVSPDDRYSALMVKCEEYRKWGVQNVWIADPQTKKFSVYDDSGSHDVRELSLPQFSFTLTPAQLFD